MNSVSLYIHVPFCASKCRYCSFNSYAGLSHLYERYAEALEEEIGLYGEGVGRVEAGTVYVGGGTPTVLSVELVARLLQACKQHFVLPEDAEISVEANPGTVDVGYLSALRELGVNRLSLGVQSFSDEMLALLGRAHTAAETRETYHLARKTGFENVNLDLIYSLPTQTLDQWKADLAEAIDLKPEHLSLYCLTVEEGTPLAEMISTGQLPFADPDLAADMYSWAEEKLREAGYGHYEISNWARNGYECQHNITYWRNRPYLGFGAGAHSLHGGSRYRNVARPQEYVRRMERGQSCVAEREEIHGSLEMSETMIMGLRLCEGVSFHDFEDRFHLPLAAVYGDQIRELVAQGLLDVNGRGARLTVRGRLLGNEVFERFLPVSNS
ncbi:MAG: coproporphyrinogen III oxidase [Chloroflexi bacterium B3_Chlor]|nr:MAG: coproporphyrinogen III oxidase [Chloroflexi bacterium B3_Chlor]